MNKIMSCYFFQIYKNKKYILLLLSENMLFKWSNIWNYSYCTLF